MRGTKISNKLITELKEEMYTNKNNEFHELTVRFDNAELSDRLYAIYVAERYSSKNRLIMDLLSDGVDAHEKAMQRHKELDTIYLSLDERQTAIETRQAEFEKTVYEQLRDLRRKHELLQNLLSCIYHMLAAICSEETIAFEELNSGFYDYLPARFERSA